MYKNNPYKYRKINALLINIIDGYNEWKENVGAVNITANDVAKTIKFMYQLPQGVSLREIVITDTMQDA